ncbi:MAG: sigma-70 family RNA polymerase sigma factor [Pseudomonadota bacterium]|nr:sigma-70 family RNA polymerase sigma factor [Pseudomonadota bacterium]
MLAAVAGVQPARRPPTRPARLTETQARAFLGTMSFGCRRTFAGDPNSDLERNPEVLAELIAHVAREHDRDAFRALFRHFAPRLKAFFLRRGLDDGSAEDLAQETMLRIWHYAAQFDPSRAAPSAWVFGIARNLRADTLRRELRRCPDLDLPEPCMPEASPEAAAIHAQREGCLREALRKLPAPQQDAVRTAYFDDLSHSVAHQMLGIPLGTLKTRLRLALARLRDALDEPPT